ncbi:MAG: hypothetical protein SWK76_17160 [Actinomycetota bacterium]|nr:hypothetical protein [Actinomycetota bacterium]
MAKRLSQSVCREFWMGRGRFSKAAMARTMAYCVNPDRDKGLGEDGSQASDKDAGGSGEISKEG